jgi:hypothetical protein
MIGPMYGLSPLPGAAQLAALEGTFEPDEHLRILAPLLGVGITIGSLAVARQAPPMARIAVAGWALLVAVISASLAISSIEKERRRSA